AGFHQRFLAAEVLCDFRWVTLAVGDGLLDGLQGEVVVGGDLLRGPGLLLPHVVPVEGASPDAPALDEELPVGRLRVRRQVLPVGRRCPAPALRIREGRSGHRAGGGEVGARRPAAAPGGAGPRPPRASARPPAPRGPAPPAPPGPPGSRPAPAPPARAGLR